MAVETVRRRSSVEVAEHVAPSVESPGMQRRPSSSVSDSLAAAAGTPTTIQDAEAIFGGTAVQVTSDGDVITIEAKTAMPTNATAEAQTPAKASELDAKRVSLSAKCCNMLKSLFLTPCAWIFRKLGEWVHKGSKEETAQGSSKRDLASESSEAKTGEALKDELYRNAVNSHQEVLGDKTDTLMSILDGFFEMLSEKNPETIEAEFKKVAPSIVDENGRLFKLLDSAMTKYERSLRRNEEKIALEAASKLLMAATTAVTRRKSAARQQ